MQKKWTKYLRKCYEAPVPEAPAPILSDMDQLHADLERFRKGSKKKWKVEKLPSIPTAEDITEGVLKREKRRLIDMKSHLMFRGSAYREDVERLNKEIQMIMKNLDSLLRA